MSLVEVLVHYRFFDIIRGRLFALGLTDRAQFVVITVLSFFLSSFLDNLTTTIVMIQIARKFFRGDNLLYAVAAIIISANAGGAFSPIGDVTTIMLWFAGKFNALEVITRAFFPALALWAVVVSIMYPKIKRDTPDENKEVIKKLTRSEKMIIATVIGSFFLPIAMNALGLPPYMGLLIGLGIVWILVDFAKEHSKHETHLTASVEDCLKRSDISSLKFFAGILLAVSALHALGVLDYLADMVYGHAPAVSTIVLGNIGLGFLSAILDNVPLTALAIQILPTTEPSLWVLLALTAGTGGSLLVIGSAAGVVAMGMVKELNFAKYLKIASIPALCGYLAAVSVWAFQYFILGF
jgi:Na+/H+ antiporter NhaD/arsenite permease-like protein